MQTNNVFSVPRFGAYLQKHIVDNIRLYMMAVVVLAGVLLMLMIFTVITGTNIPVYSDLIPFYMIGMFITGMIFTSMTFSHLADKSRGIDFLLMPASHFEKFLTTWLITTVGFLLVYHIAFFAAVYIGASIIAAKTGLHLRNDLGEYGKHFPWYNWYFVWFVVQAIFLLGAIYMHKFSYIKTMFALIIFVAGLYFVNLLIVNILFGNHMAPWYAAAPFIGNNTWDQPEHFPGRGLHYVALFPPKGMTNAYLFIAKYLVAPVLWTLTYFRLKDKEI